MRQLPILIFIFLTLLYRPEHALAAIGCTLSNPAQDLKYLFPEMTSYKEEVKEFGRLPDGKELYSGIPARIGGELDPIYEGFETPFTVYTIFRTEELIGVVHGVNVPGRGGVIQVFLSTDPKDGTIRQLFFQRIESSAAKALRRPDFRNQFTGLSLRDFYKHDYYSVAGSGSVEDKVSAIKSPPLDEESLVDYKAVIRGTKKNLVLLDFFVYGRASEAFFARAQEALKAKGQ